MILNSAAKAFGILSISTLIACGGPGSSGSNPVTGPATEADNVTDTTDPNANSVDDAFLFDTSRNLVANSFVFNPGTTPGTGTISINNLPFDGVSSQGGEYTLRPGVVLPSGEVYQNSPVGNEDQYYAVVLTSPTGSGTLVGAVATNVYLDETQSYGGAYASRTSRGLPATQPQAYQYTGSYNGIRVIRQNETTSPNNDIQLTTGQAQVNIDLQDFDLTGAIRGDIINRQLFDINGNSLGTLGRVELIITDLDPSNLQTTNGTTANLNSNRTVAQTGEWTGLVAGPNGEEVAGFLLIQGALPDTDPSYETDTARAVVTGREVGGFIATR